MRNTFWCKSILALLIGVTMSTPQASSDDVIQPEPGKKIKVFLFAGQSNMEGRADGRKLTRDDEERLQGIQQRVQLAYNNQPLRPLNTVAPPSDIASLYKVDQIFGPELFLGIKLAETWPEEKLLLIKFAFGATSLYGAWNPDWTPEKAAMMKDEEEARLYARLVDYVKQVLSGYPPDSYEICAMFWVQGEGDGKVEQAAEVYGSLLRTLIEGIRKEIGTPAMPFILLQVGSDKVVEGMKQTAEDVKHVTLVPQSQDTNSPDFYAKIPNGHYNHEGMKKIGERFATVYLGEYAAKQK